MLNPANGNDAAELINAAYGLVQGVFGNGNMMSDAGHEVWKNDDIQIAAAKAAEQFLVDAKAALAKARGDSI